MLAAVVDLPTPPLPDAIAMMCLTPGMASPAGACCLAPCFDWPLPSATGSGLTLACFGGQRHEHVRDAGDATYCLVDGGADAVHRARIGRIGGERGEHLALAHSNALQDACFGDGAAVARLDGVEHGVNTFLGQHVVSLEIPVDLIRFSARPRPPFVR
ncbi:MAG: hypothetical protein IPL47_11290 [Phyllobacteriaceae bacterium]|nr:hypothetical protein [Phyllobacteriaceae bacterium]